MAFGYVVALRNEDMVAMESNEFHMALFVKCKIKTGAHAVRFLNFPRELVLILHW